MVERHRPIADGYFRALPDAWEALMETAPRPVSEDVALTDLSYMEDRASTSRGRNAFSIPGARKLSERWGWSRWKAGTFMAEHLKPKTSHQAATKQPEPGRTAAGDEPDKADIQAETSHQAATKQPEPGREPVRARSRSENRDRGQRSEEGERVGSATESLPGINPPPQPNPETLPDWLGKERRIPAGSRSRFLDLVMKAHQMVRGEVESGILSLAPPGSPKRMKTFSGHVAALWKATGADNVEEFGRDLLLVIDAAKRCPDPLFARDIRAEGWAEGVDRSGEIETICRHSKWDSRIEAARKWKRVGSPTGRLGPVANGGYRGGHWSAARAAAEAIAAERSNRQFADDELEVIHVEEAQYAGWK